MYSSLCIELVAGVCSTKSTAVSVIVSDLIAWFFSEQRLVRILQALNCYVNNRFGKAESFWIFFGCVLTSSSRAVRALTGMQNLNDMFFSEP